MDILNIDFETPITLTVDNQVVKVIAFKTNERGNIKFGIEAPRTLKVNREEVYLKTVATIAAK